MDVVRSLKRVYGFHVQHMPDDMITIGNAVSAVNVTGRPRNIERLAGAIPLEQGNHLRAGAPVIAQSAQMQTRVQPERNLRLHVSKLLLDQLVGAQWSTKLNSVKRVLTRGM